MTTNATGVPLSYETNLQMPDAVQMTRKLIAFETINPPGRERACAEYLAALLANAKFDVSLNTLHEDRASIVARRGGSRKKPPLVFTGHLDVVPLGTTPWTRDPFGGEIVDGRLYGRGSSDMKSGVAAFVVAAIAASDSLGDDYGIMLIVTAGEETGCHGAAALCRDGSLGPAGALIVAEPTGNRPFIGHKGALWLKATTRGISAHGSMPERGDNAIYKAAKAIERLRNLDFKVSRHPALGWPTLNVGTIHGGMNINSVPDRTEIEIDIRTTPSIDHVVLKETVRKAMGENADIEVLIDLPGVWTAPQIPWVARSMDIASKITGVALTEQTATYFSDASVLTPALGDVPTLILGPGEPTQAHQTDEWCEVTRISQAVDIFSAIIADWCGALATTPKSLPEHPSTQ
jgi:succinyl-diaminopimelate desuccinylase